MMTRVHFLLALTVAALLAGCSAGSQIGRRPLDPAVEAAARAAVTARENPRAGAVLDSTECLPFLGDELEPWWSEEPDSTDLETDLLLDSLVVPLETPTSSGARVPDISDSLAAATKARLPSVEELFDYPVVVNGRVLAWVDAYLGSLRGFFDRSLRRSGQYLAMARRIFREEGIPQDLAFLAHVESGFRHNARSPAKALGLWQFMRGTAQLYGLRCDSYVDERLDPERATRAAARYLRDLHALYGDWCLALAAYNAGAGKVNRAINRTSTRDFWSIASTNYLRDETRDFVPAIMAVTILSKSPGAYGLTMETEPPLDYEVAWVDTPTDLRIAARCAGVRLDDLQMLNPALLLNQTPPGSYELRLPKGTGEQFARELRKVPATERFVQVRHKVRRGETLGLIASRYHTTVHAIQDANRMGRRTMIRTGQTLTIPSRGGEAQASTTPARQERQSTTHRVSRGETLAEIARHYGVSTRELQQVNHISNPNRIRIGQRLQIPGSVAATEEPSSEPSPVETTPPEPVSESPAPNASGRDEASSEEPPAATQAPQQAAAPADSRTGNAVSRDARVDSDIADSLGRVASTAHIVAQARLTVAAEPASSAATSEQKPAAAPESPRRDSSPAPRIHIVRRGETLSEIADKYGVRVDDLIAWNRLGRRSTIYPRQQLVVSGTATKDSGGDARVHVVRHGDSLWKIARRYGVQVSELAEWNNLGKRGRIYPGQRILVY